MSADNRESTLKNLEQIKNTWQDKLYFLEEKRAIIANANEEFELKNRIKECRQEIERIAKEIESLKKESQQKTFILKPVNPAIKRYSGKLKMKVCQNLIQDWQGLADYFEIPLEQRASFEAGRQPYRIWEWLEQRSRLGELEVALSDIGRDDLVEELKKTS
jgi:chromosome segregation ATPase